MRANPQASKLRQEIRRLAGERRRLERILTEPKAMLNACLIARRKLAGGRKRRTPAWYLSRKVAGRTRLEYVRQSEAAGIRRQTEAWRRFARALAGWVKVSRDLERRWRRLGRVQVTRRRPRGSDGHHPRSP
jgi:hypothetical protein